MVAPCKPAEGAPPVGVYRDVPEKLYRAWPLPSSTALKVMDAKTPAHCRWSALNPAESKSMRLGSAVHALVLQPHRYRDLFAVAPKVDRRTKHGQIAWEQFQAEASGLTVLTEAEDFVAHEMAAKVRDKPIIRQALGRCPERELSVVGKIDGLDVKARLDAYGNGLVIDLKTAADATDGGFLLAVTRYGYGLQAAVYRAAARGAGLTANHFAFVVVENEPPYEPRVFRLEDDVIDRYEARAAALVRQWWACKLADQWPGYPDTIEEVGVTAWERRRLEETNGND